MSPVKLFPVGEERAGTRARAHTHGTFSPLLSGFNCLVGVFCLRGFESYNLIRANGVSGPCVDLNINKL